MRRSADLGFIPVVVEDACGSSDVAAGERSLAALRFAGDAILATTDSVVAALAGD